MLEDGGSFRHGTVHAIQPHAQAMPREMDEPSAKGEGPETHWKL